MQNTIPETFYVTGGTLPLDAQSYVTRQADHDLFNALEQGHYCYVLNSRQMGKSSLMTRCAQKLRMSGVRVHILDLQKYGSNLTAEQWYRGILEDLIIGLELPLEGEGVLAQQPGDRPAQPPAERDSRLRAAFTC